tara:strand:- start:2190 stop:2777 length:588 start_codon:yes stop_codon:yes gene_type:complete
MNTLNKNFDFLNSFINVSEETFTKLQNIATFKVFDAHTEIAKTGEICTKIYMLVSGLIRVYLRAESGKEYNKHLYTPISFVGPFTSLIKKTPSKLTYETLTDCEVYEICFADIVNLRKSDLTISNLYGNILEQVFIKDEKRQLELISLDATQRYLKLKKQIPNIDALIPQYQIASYLSITPVQMSRIRKNINECH